MFVSGGCSEVYGEAWSVNEDRRLPTGEDWA